MSYEPKRISIPNGLDERGLRLGLNRLPTESLARFRRRLLLETRDPSGPTQVDLIRTVGRKVSQFDVPVLTLTLSGDDPLVEVTSTRLLVYTDREEDPIVSADLDQTRWLKDLRQVLVDAGVVVSTLEADHEYLRSNSLRYDSSDRFSVESLGRGYVTRLDHPSVRDAFFSDPTGFVTEKESREEVVEDGDFWVDYEAGVVVSHRPQSGQVYYSYRSTSFVLYHQPVRLYPYADADLDRRHKELLVDDDGQLSHLLLNSVGARLADVVLAVHPLTWGR